MNSHWYLFHVKNNFKNGGYKNMKEVAVKNEINLSEKIKEKD